MSRSTKFVIVGAMVLVALYVFLEVWFVKVSDVNKLPERESVVGHGSFKDHPGVEALLRAKRQQEQRRAIPGSF